MTQPQDDLFYLGLKALIQNDKEEILLLKYRHTHADQKTAWGLPGGRIQKNESLHEGLRREVTEETGISDLTIIEEIGFTHTPYRISAGESLHAGMVYVVYHCSVPPDTKITLSDEHTEYVWLSKEKAIEILQLVFSQELIEKIKTI